MDFSQKEAAEALGLKRRVVQYYEKGERDGKSIDIPKTVRLACFALTQGTQDYDGPAESGSRKGKKRNKDKDKEKEGGKHKGGKGKKHGKAVKPEEEPTKPKPKDEAEKTERSERRKTRK